MACGEVRGLGRTGAGLSPFLPLTFQGAVVGVLGCSLHGAGQSFRADSVVLCCKLLLLIINKMLKSRALVSLWLELRELGRGCCGPGMSSLPSGSPSQPKPWATLDLFWCRVRGCSGLEAIYSHCGRRFFLNSVEN